MDFNVNYFGELNPMTDHFKGYVTEYDEKGRPTKVEVSLVAGDDLKRAREIMYATGVGSELEAVIMVFRRYHPDFLAWWKGDSAKAPQPITGSRSETPNALTGSTTPEIEQGIWSAVTDKRDWDETEKEYLQRNESIRNTLIQWAVLSSKDMWTEANLEFLRSCVKEKTP